MGAGALGEDVVAAEGGVEHYAGCRSRVGVLRLLFGGRGFVSNNGGVEGEEPFDIFIYDGGARVGGGHGGVGRLLRKKKGAPW